MKTKKTLHMNLLKSTKLLAALLLSSSAAVYLTSCSDDDDHDFTPTTDFVNELNKLYPNVDAEWETRHNNYRVAEFDKMGDEYEVWFSKEGQWVMTEIDYEAPYTNVPADIMTAFYGSEYGEWAIDDIDYYERASDSFYIFDVEQRGQYDMDVYFDADGNFIKAERDTDIDIRPSTVIK